METRTPSVGMSRGRASARARPREFPEPAQKENRKAAPPRRFVVEATPLGEEGSLRRPQGCCEGHIH